MTYDFAFITAAEPDGEGTVDVISTAGGWLYDYVGGGLDDHDATLFFIPSSDLLKIRHISMPLPALQSVRMPQVNFTIPTLIPPNHDALDAPAVDHPALFVPFTAEPVIVDLSLDSAHGFPFISVNHDDDGPSFKAHNLRGYDGYGAQISTLFCNRLIRTWWRPQVEVGRPCPHSDDYGRMTRCSLTSKQILLQVKPLVDPLSTRQRLSSFSSTQNEAEQVADIFSRYHK
jgi:hypothetical protein